MGQVVSIVNQKGGVGKTTLTTGLASAAMARGHRVLVVDLDPQGASTWVLGIEPSTVDGGVAKVLEGARGGATKALQPSQWSHLVDVLPASSRLQHLEVQRGGLEQLVGGRKPQRRLHAALAEVTPAYGLVLIDCPPSLGDLTTSGLAASDKTLIVVEPSALAVRGVGPVADLIEETWSELNGELDLAGVIVNRMARSIDARAHRDVLARIVGESAVWEPAIPHRVVIAEAAAKRRPIHQMGARAADAIEVFDLLYDQLWELIRPRRSTGRPRR